MDVGAPAARPHVSYVSDTHEESSLKTGAAVGSATDESTDAELLIWVLLSQWFCCGGGSATSGSAAGSYWYLLKFRLMKQKQQICSFCK